IELPMPWPIHGVTKFSVTSHVATKPRAATFVASFLSLLQPCRTTLKSFQTPDCSTSAKKRSSCTSSYAGKCGRHTWVSYRSCSRFPQPPSESVLQSPHQLDSHQNVILAR